MKINDWEEVGGNCISWKFEGGVGGVVEIRKYHQAIRKQITRKSKRLNGHIYSQRGSERKACVFKVNCSILEDIKTSNTIPDSCYISVAARFIFMVLFLVSHQHFYDRIMLKSVKCRLIM